jgi:glutamate synthase (NADPH) large chain
MRRYRDAIDAGLLKIMSKMGISVISSYRGGLNFEAVGLSRAMVAEYFPGMHSRISGIGLPASSARPRRSTPAAGGRVGRAADRRLLQGAPVGRKARLGSADDAPAAIGLRPGVLRPVEAVFGRDAANPPIHCATCWTSSRWASRCRSRRWNHHLDPQAVRDAGHVAGGAVARGAHDAEHRHEPDRRQVRLGEGGEDPAHSRPLPNGDNPSAPRSSRWPRAGSA